MRPKKHSEQGSGRVNLKVEVEELPHFFRHHTSEKSGFGDEETARQFRELQSYLEESSGNV